jgi:predicted Holliday junction resolvase-like endonuclease
MLGLVLVITALGLYTEYLYKRLKQVKKERNVQKALLVSEKRRATTELYMCKKDLMLFRKELEVEKNTNEEIEEKINKGKDYEILATDKRDTCGCYRDPNGGWVFK